MLINNNCIFFFFYLAALSWLAVPNGKAKEMDTLLAFIMYYIPM